MILIGANDIVNLIINAPFCHHINHTTLLTHLLTFSGGIKMEYWTKTG